MTAEIICFLTTKKTGISHFKKILLKKAATNLHSFELPVLKAKVRGQSNN